MIMMQLLRLLILDLQGILVSSFVTEITKFNVMIRVGLLWPRSAFHVLVLDYLGLGS